jgi:hypothetical protein
MSTVDGPGTEEFLARPGMPGNVCVGELFCGENLGG